MNSTGPTPSRHVLAQPGLPTPLFSLPVGQVSVPADFSPSDIRMDAGRFGYEGNWLFCRFVSDKLPGARLGFGRGTWDARDMGGAALMPPTSLFTHLELITDRGAFLFTDATHFSTANLEQGEQLLDLTLRGKNREPILSIQGWPSSQWQMRTPDGSMDIELDVRPRVGLVLPDLVMPNTQFAMWVFACVLRGRARIAEVTHDLRGVGFFDRPRIQTAPQQAEPWGWLIYAPMVCPDGSTVLSYLSASADGRMNRDYCFAWRHQSNGRSDWWPNGEVLDLEFDEDRLPCSWRARWGEGGDVIHAEFKTTPTPVRRTIGDPTRTLARAEVANLPLLFAGVYRVGDQSIRGSGVAEYITAIPQRRSGNHVDQG